MHEISACNRLSFFFEGFPGRNSRAISMLSLLLLNTPHNINIHNLYNRPEEEC